ncbi:MAG: tetratricopeptide repeat protein [Alphaproteobacteria bacterium]|nr:tetratricopeptide repeat protein [Alphaproteobacteria bacterium]
MAKSVKNKNEINTKNVTAVKSGTPAAPRRGRRDLSDVNPELTDAFIQEVDEDVKNDNLKVLWDKYGLFIVAFVVLAVSAAVSFDKLHEWKVLRNQNRTENYMAAVQLQDNSEETIAALQKISTDNQGIFSDFAKLQIANVLLSENKQEEALSMLEKLAAEKNVNEEVKHVALVKLASYRVDSLGYEEFAALVKPLTETDNSWTPAVQDLLAMSAIKNGNIEDAKEIYSKILKNKELPEGFVNRIKDMLSSISDM